MIATIQPSSTKPLISTMKFIFLVSAIVSLTVCSAAVVESSRSLNAAASEQDRLRERVRERQSERKRGLKSEKYAKAKQAYDKYQQDLLPVLTNLVDNALATSPSKLMKSKKIIKNEDNIFAYDLVDEEALPSTSRSKSMKSSKKGDKDSKGNRSKISKKGNRSEPPSFSPTDSTSPSTAAMPETVGTVGRAESRIS